jgi:PAS domain S-box-containing protein
MSHNLKQRYVFHLYALVAFAGYAVFFLLFHPVIGDSVAIFAFLPALVIAWMWGIKYGIIAGFVADILTLALLHVDGDNCVDLASLRQRLPGLLAVVIVAAIVGYMRELRDRVKKELEWKTKAEADLRESESRFKSIFEGSNDALMLLDEKGFFDCNPCTLEMFGFKDKEEFTRIHPADISPPNQPDGKESFPAAQERIKTAFEQGSNRFEWVHRKKNGEDFPAEVLLSAFSLNGKQVLQATVRDISKRKQAEESLRKSEAMLHGIYSPSRINGR